MRATMTCMAPLLFAAAAFCEPVTLWTHSASGALSAGPAVADLSDSPGLETVVAGTGGVRCLNAQGAPLWESTAGFESAVFLAPALSNPLASGKRAAAVLTLDGVLTALDTGSGKTLWQHALGAACTGLVWCDLTGDNTDDLAVGTKDKGIFAFSSDGAPLWAFTEQELGRAPALSGPLAALDVDENRRQEIVAVDSAGPICLDSSGKVLWQSEQEGVFSGVLAALPPGDDGIPRLYCLAGAVLYAFDAGVGDVLWKCPIDGFSKAVTLALGDLDRDEAPDIVVGSDQGDVAAAGSDGKLLWKTAAAKNAPVHLVVGDADADTMLEILAAGGDGVLHVLDAGGEPKSSLAGVAPIGYAPVLADLDGSGTTCLLYADATLHCAVLGSKYVPELMPWPMEGATISRTYSLAQRGAPSAALSEETQALLAQGGLDTAEAGLPRGWKAEKGAADRCSVDTQSKMAGEGCLCVQPGGEEMILASGEVKAGPELQGISAVAMSKGPEGARALVRWVGARGVLREDALQVRQTTAEGWRRFNLNETRTPLGARAIVMVLVSPAGGTEPTYWDEAQITGSIRLIPQAQVFVNQVGYESGAPKFFTVWSNFKAKNAKFTVRSGEQEYAAALSDAVQITGAYDSAWDGYYWRGDFSTYEGLGTHAITVTLDQVSARSVSFEVGPDVLWNRALETALSAFRYNRCGVAEAPCHEACHLDDALEAQSLTGGWHDGTDYGKTGTPWDTLELATAYSITKWKLDAAKDSPMGRVFLDEVNWGGLLVLHSLRPDGSALPSLVSNPEYWGPAEKETDNQPNTGDERKAEPNAAGDPSLHGAALARLARLQPENAALREGAERALAWALAHNVRGTMQFATALDLFFATKEEKFGQLAQELLPKADPAIGESLNEYDAEFEPLVSTTFELAGVLNSRVDTFLSLSQNPFGVYASGTALKVNYFETPADASGALTGNSTHVLEAAALAATAFRFKPTPEYKQFIYDQLNWILGCNPYGISLMEGAGKRFAPSYLQRYTAGGLARGAVPGAIANGISGKGPGDDRPAFDMSGAEKPNGITNACSLRNNVLFVKALCNLKRIRVGAAR